MKVCKLLINMTNGVNDHPVAMLVQVASRFNSAIYVEENGMRANAKSIMGMMALGLKNGTHVNIEAVGEDAADAIRALEDYLHPVNISLS